MTAKLKRYLHPYFITDFNLPPPPPSHTTHRMTISTSSHRIHIYSNYLSTPRYHVEFLGRFYIFVLFIPIWKMRKEKSLSLLLTILLIYHFIVVVLRRREFFFVEMKNFCSLLFFICVLKMLEII